MHERRFYVILFAYLARLGETCVMRMNRKLNTLDAVALTVSTMVGAGIFTILSLTVKTAGPAAVVAWLLVVVLSLPMAYTFSDLTGVLAESGGPYVYLRTKTKPWIGLSVGWSFLLSSIGAAAALFMALVGMLVDLGVPNGYSIGLLILVVLACVTAYGVHVGASLQRILTLSTVGILLLCIGIGLFHMRWSHVELVHASGIRPKQTLQSWTVKFAPHGWTAVLPATFFAFWTYSGWEAVAAPSGAYTSRKALARGMMIGSFVVGFLYVCVALVAVGAVSSKDIASHLNPLVLLGNLWSSSVGAVIGWGAVIIVVGSLLSWLIASAALVQALTRDGLLPGPKFIREHRGTYHGILPILVAILLAVIAKLPIFAFMIAASSMTALVAYAVVFMAVALDKEANWAGVIKTPRRRRAMAWVALVMALALVAFSGWSNFWPTILLLAVGGVLIWLRWAAGKLRATRPSEAVPE